MLGLTRSLTENLFYLFSRLLVAKVWLACAVGMCCGGGMYFVAFFGVAGVVAILRFGPRSPMPEDEDVPEAKAVGPAVAEGKSSSKPLLLEV